MLDRKALLEDIRLGLSVFQHYIRPGGRLNKNDVSVTAEDFVANLLNAIKGWDLVNTNRKKTNYPCIDLRDTKKKIGVQVTAEEGADKVNTAIKCVGTSNDVLGIERFIHFSLIPKQGTYKVTASAAGIAFDKKTDILDFDDVQLLAQALSDDADVRKVRDIVVFALPQLFASEANRLSALRDEIKDGLTVFDREVMYAPFQREDPVLMLTAIKEMRISLQRMGASRISHPELAKLFKKARSILSSCEGRVKDEYPRISAAAASGGDPGYEGDEYGAAIRLMMEIRPEIQDLIDKGDTVLELIDVRLGSLRR